jgi:hypothetical protein
MSALVWLAMRAYPIALADFEANTQRRAQQSAEFGPAGRPKQQPDAAD